MLPKVVLVNITGDVIVEEKANVILREKLEKLEKLAKVAKLKSH
jgi:hypothetical protein